MPTHYCRMDPPELQAVTALGRLAADVERSFALQALVYAAWDGAEVRCESRWSTRSVPG